VQVSRLKPWAKTWLPARILLKVVLVAHIDLSLVELTRVLNSKVPFPVSLDPDLASEELVALAKPRATASETLNKASVEA